MKKAFAKILIVMVAALLLSAPQNAVAKELSGDLEIFSWWAGDEGPALQALIDIYKKQNPKVEVINATVTGGSGVNAKAVLRPACSVVSRRIPSRFTPDRNSSVPGSRPTAWKI